MPYTAQRRTAYPYSMKGQLAIEARHKQQVLDLFGTDRVLDISGEKTERKSGTDFLLQLLNSDGSARAPIRCENKFEQRCTGRQVFEVVSVDRPCVVPGWMFTSRAAWLLSWFPSGELIALPMDQARELVFSNPLRHKATTAANARYLTWSVLEDVDYVVRNIKDARVLDLSDELGLDFEESGMLCGASLHKQCTVQELMDLMRTHPAESTPLAATADELMELCRKLTGLNLCKRSHAGMLNGLPWLQTC